MIQPQVTRGITLGLAAVTAAMSALAAQFQVGPQGGSQSPPAAPMLAADRLQMAPGLEMESSQGALAAAQARQVAEQPAAGGAEAAGRAPALAKRTATPPPTSQPQPGSGTASSSAVPAANVPPGSVQDIIVKAFTPYGPAAVQWGLRVAKCESGYNPSAVNPSGPYYGLFQFLMSTFKNTPYGDQNVLDPVANASAAAWKYGNYGPGAWGCR